MCVLKGLTRLDATYIYQAGPTRDEVICVSMKERSACLKLLHGSALQALYVCVERFDKAGYYMDIRLGQHMMK